jgi:large subunit ribosomal protein L6
MVKGVEEGFEKRLQFEGVGYRAKVEENYLILNVGYSKPVEVLIPKQVSVNVENPTKICVSGLQKDIVGSFASKISSIRPPEPYKGKGIILEGTVIRRKAGKTGK